MEAKRAEKIFPQDVVPEATGYVFLRGDELEALSEVLAEGTALLEARRSAARTGKEYLQQLLTAEDLQQRPAFMRLATSPRVVAMAAHYLGTTPRIRTVHLYWTPTNDSLMGSQFFHFDHVGERQLKLFVYLKAVAAGEGPFTFVPADISATVKPNLPTNKMRYRDEAVLDERANSRALQFMGPAGAAALVDTTRCLHFGGRARSSERLMMMVQYIRPQDDLETADLVRPYEYPPQ